MKSIYDMDNEALDSLIQSANEAYTFARDQARYETMQYKAMISDEAGKMTPEKFENSANQYKNMSMLDAMETAKHYRDLVQAGFTNMNINQLTPLHVFNYKLKAPEIFDAVSKPARQYLLDISKTMDGFTDIIKEFGLKEPDFKKIGVYLYATEKGNRLGLDRIAYQLKKTGINYVDNTPVLPADIPELLARYQADDFLDAGQKKMAEYIRQSYKDISPRIRQTAYEEKNQVFADIENYFPHRQDYKANGFGDIDPDYIDGMTGKVMNNTGLLKKNVDSKFMEDRTGKLFILDYDAYRTFISSIDNLTYFANVQ